MANDPAEELRRRLGIAGPAKVRVGGLQPGSFEALQAAYEAHMKMLAHGGADQSGREEWVRRMRRLGRRS